MRWVFGLLYLGTVLSFCQTLVFCFCRIVTWSYEVCFIEMMVIGNSKERIGISWGRPQQDSGLSVWIHQTSSTFHSEKVPGDDHHASPTAVHTPLLFRSSANSTAQLALEPVVDTTADPPPPSSPWLPEPRLSLQQKQQGCSLEIGPYPIAANDTACHKQLVDGMTSEKPPAQFKPPPKKKTVEEFCYIFSCHCPSWSWNLGKKEPKMGFFHYGILEHWQQTTGAWDNTNIHMYIHTYLGCIIELKK